MKCTANDTCGRCRKRLFLLPVAALLMCLIAGCLSGGNGGEGAPSTEAVISTTLPKEESVPFSAPETGPAEDAVVPPSAETEAWITIDRQEQVQYTDSVGNDYDAVYTIPVFAVDSPDARACNQALREAGEAVVEAALQNQQDGTSLVDLGMDYETWVRDNSVTLLVTISNSWDCDRHLIYSLTLPEGALLDRDSMAAAWDLTPEQADAAISATLRQCFEERYAVVEQDDFYREQLERTCSDENLADAVLYPASDGTPMVLAKIYSLAGGDYYERMIPLVMPGA